MAFRRRPLLRPPMRPVSAATTRATSRASAGNMISTANHVANASRLRRQEHQPADWNDERHRRQPVLQLAYHLTQRGSFFGLDAVQFAEVFYARQRLTNYTWNVAPGGGLGALSSFYD